MLANFSLSYGSQAKKFDIAFRISLIQPNFYKNNVNLTANIYSKFGFGLGMSFHIPITDGLFFNHDGFALELNLMAQSVIFESFNLSPLDDYVEANGFYQPSIIHVPILIKYYLYRLNDEGINLQMGPSIQWSMDDYGSPFKVGCIVGLGFDVGKNVTVDFRYEWSFSEIVGDIKLRRFYFGFSL